MTAHRKDFADLRVGCRVTLRNWKGDSISGEAFMDRDGEWLARTTSGAVFPILSRELIAVALGAAQVFNSLREGARVLLADWQGGRVSGIAHHNPGGVWECREADGARWLIEPYRLMEVAT